MPASTPGPPTRPERPDYIDDHGVWMGTTTIEDLSRADVMIVLPDARDLVPESRRGGDAPVSSTVLHATWKTKIDGNEEVCGSLSAVVEFRPGPEQ